MVNMVVYIESNKISVRTSNSTFRMIALQAGMKPITFCLTPTFLCHQFCFVLGLLIASWTDTYLSSLCPHSDCTDYLGIMYE